MLDLNESLKQTVIPNFSYMTTINHLKLQPTLAQCSAVILIITNNLSDSKTLSIYLKQQGFEVITVCNAKLGFEQAQFYRPNLILLETNLVDMDSLEICRCLKRDKNTKNTPVIFLSESNDIQDKIIAFQAGGTDYIAKPFWVEEVFMRINTHLAQQTIQQGLEKKVKEQTNNLQNVTKQLNEESTRRRNYAMEKDILLSLLDQQNEQLRLLGQILETTQQDKRISSTDLSQDHGQLDKLGQPNKIVESLLLLQSYIEMIHTLVEDETDWQKSASYEIVVNQLNLALMLIAKITNNLSVNTANEAIDENEMLFSHLKLISHLSSREKQVLNLIVQGKPTTEIAIELVITEATVRTYRHRIMKKLQLKNRDELFRFASAIGLI